MYCGQCGKKVMENMLFCPFCGSPIVIPEQDEPAEASPAVAPETEDHRVSEGQISLFDDVPAPEPEPEPVPREEFVPLSFSFDDETEEREATDAPAAAEEDRETEAPEAEELPEADIGDEIIILQEEPAEEEIAPEPEPKPAAAPRRKPARPARESAGPSERKRAVSTFVPFKDMDPEDLFMDERSLDPEDEYDLPDDYDSDFEEDFDFEEPEEGSFFQRHIRGIVGLILLLVLVLIVAIWAISPKGQTALARINLAWDAETYADLGYEAYQQDSDLLAARYYEKALARDSENYDYAHSAMVAYYEADRIESASSMLKKCVEMRPDSAEPYHEMMILYPDPATRPWEITELIRMGYARTGDEGLNID